MSNSASILAAIGGFAAYLLLTGLLLRALPRHPAHVAVGLAVALFPAPVIAGVLMGHTIFFWSYSAVFGALTTSFLMAFGAIYKSISFTILLDLYRVPGRTEKYDTVLRRLVRGESFEKRLEVMTESGFVEREGERYVLQPKGRRLARFVGVFHSIFGIERSG